MRLRAATSGDAAALAALERDAFPDPWSEGLVAAQLANARSFTLLAEAAAPGTAAGAATFLVAADEAELLRIAVRPAARRHGLARELLRAGLAHLRDRGIARCHLEVRADNAPAIGLYEGLGFAPVGTRRRYYRDGTDALLYAVTVA